MFIYSVLFHPGLDALRMNSALLRGVQEFLKGLFASENLEFWQQVQDFQTLTDEKEVSYPHYFVTGVLTGLVNSIQSLLQLSSTL